MNLNEFWNFKINFFYNIFYCILKIQLERGILRYVIEEINFSFVQLFKRVRVRKNILERRYGKYESRNGISYGGSQEVGG